MEPLSGVLFSLYRGSPQYGDWVVAGLAAAWPGIVGERLAAECRPIRFRQAELVIAARDRGWAEALRGMKPRLLEKLRAATAGAVADLSVVAGEAGGGGRDPVTPR
jgi:hypothetical protein